MHNAENVQDKEKDKLEEVEEIKRDRFLALRRRREQTWRVSCCFAVFFAVALGCSMSIGGHAGSTKDAAPIASK